jgi:hypothetical protein
MCLAVAWRVNSMSDIFFDRNMTPLVAGDSVKVVEIPESLPQGLPQEDQDAIMEQLGKILTILDFNQRGGRSLNL